MANLYTKTGDKGETSLYGGKRVSKDSLRVDCYGTIDETISMLGLAYAQETDTDIRENIHGIQKRLFSVGAELASDSRGLAGLEGKISDEDVAGLEKLVDRCTETTGKQTAFVVPGVNSSSAALHVARTVIRRAERKIIALRREDEVRDTLLRYVNRLSDALYALARLKETRTQEQEIREKVLDILADKFPRLTGGDGKDNGVPFTLENLKKMASFAEEKAGEIKVPVVFSAVDNGGNLLLLHRMEGALLGSIDISRNKAYTANAFQMPTHELAAVAGPDQTLYGIQNTNEGKVVIFGGGYPYWYQGSLAGAIGVSGGTVEQDMQVASYALDRIKGGNR